MGEIFPETVSLLKKNGNCNGIENYIQRTLNFVTAIPYMIPKSCFHTCNGLERHGAEDFCLDPDPDG